MPDTVPIRANPCQARSRGEFVAFAAFRWGLLHELFMDEHKNGAALGGELLKAEWSLTA